MSAPRRLGVRKVERWITPDGREWPNAAEAAEHQRLAILREWFDENVVGIDFENSSVPEGGHANALARAFDEKFAYTRRSK